MNMFSAFITPFLENGYVAQAFALVLLLFVAQGAVSTGKFLFQYFQRLMNVAAANADRDRQQLKDDLEAQKAEINDLHKQIRSLQVDNDQLAFKNAELKDKNKHLHQVLEASLSTLRAHALVGPEALPPPSHPHSSEPATREALH